MRAPILFVLLAAYPVSEAAANDPVPIAGLWRSEPSRNFIGPSILKISDEQIVFGPKPEALPSPEHILSWKKDNQVIEISTSGGHNYAFRVNSLDHICLVSRPMPVRSYGPTEWAQVRCYIKYAENSK